MACPRGAPCSGHGQQGHRVPTGCKVQPVCPQGAWDVAGTARTSPRGPRHGREVPMGCRTQVAWPGHCLGVQGTATVSPWGAWHGCRGHKVPMGCMAQLRCPHGVHGTARASPRHRKVRAQPRAMRVSGGGVPAGTCTPGISTQITWPGSGSAALLLGRGTQGHRDTGTQGRGRFPQPQGGAAQPRCSRMLATSSTAALRHHGHGRGHAHSPWLLLRSAPNPAQENGAGDVGTWGHGDAVPVLPLLAPHSPAQGSAQSRGCSTHFPQHGSLAKKIADSGQPESLVGQK